MGAELTVVLGGARSGKSSYAEQLVSSYGQIALYVATAQARDAEMGARVAAHSRTRPATWRTVEAPCAVGEAVRGEVARGAVDVVLLDCLTLLVSNVILSGVGEDDLDQIDEPSARQRVKSEIDGLLAAATDTNVPWVVVSNEVGWGLVPPYPVGRVYRDLLGWANQRLAAAADRVFLMVAGLPVDVKALSAVQL